MDYIPNRVHDFFVPISFEDKHDLVISSGKMRCTCSCEDFAIQYTGHLRKTLFGQIFIQATENGDLNITLTCRDCNKTLLLFDSRADGYNAIASRLDGLTYPPFKAPEDSVFENQPNTLSCVKCKTTYYRVKVKYEHADKAETDTDYIEDYQSAFSWFVVDIECGTCAKKHRGFIDMELG